MNPEKMLDLLFGNIIRFFRDINFKKEERGPVSVPFVCTLLMVLVYGLIMLFSASYATGYYRWDGDIYHFIRPQTIVAVVGLGVMFLISNVNYRSLRHVNWYLYALTIVLLIWALFSEAYNDCHRWVYVFGTTLQPSELAKFSAILGVACCYDDETGFRRRNTLWYGILRPLLPLAPFVVLLRMEPHNSAILLLVLIVGTMMACGWIGAPWWPETAALGGVLLYRMLTSSNNDVANQRLGAWGLFSSSDENTLYQTRQSLYSIASGGLTGLGIGNSRQKHLWLPEATNDFIFSVLCEELGFLGAVLCIVLFAALILEGIFIALKAPDRFGTMLGIGITAQIAWQTFCHIGVVTATLPNTGISLPFFSSGGTSLLILLCEMGVMLSISRAGNAAHGARSRYARRARQIRPAHSL